VGAIQAKVLPARGLSSWVLVAALGALMGCGRHERSAPRADASTVGDAGAPPVLHAHRTRQPLHIDGELKEADWHDDDRTGPFLDATGHAARPFSEAMALVDGDLLVLGLYAADQDIEAHVRDHDGPVWTDDAFVLRFAPPGAEKAPFAIDVSATGVIADGRIGRGGAVDTSWESGARAVVDHDGTINDASNEDEEWVVEMTVPLAALGARAGSSLKFEVSRCDTPKRARRTCASWGHGAAGPVGVLELAP
jgi:hypothetical protein